MLLLVNVRLVALYFTVCVLTVNLHCKKVLVLHGIGLGLGVGSVLVPSYYLVIVITIISTYYVHEEQDCKIKCYC